jgi:hypothetical protein
VVPNSAQQQQTTLADGTPATSMRFLVAPDQGAKGPNLDVMLVYDGKSRRAWWTYQRTEQTTASVDPVRPWVIARARDDRALVGFVLLATRLVARASAASADSLAAAQSRAVDDVSRSIAAIQEGSDEQGTEINLTGSIPNDFFYEAFNASPVSKARIRRVAPTSGGWDVTLEGAGTQTARVVLSDDLRLVNVTVAPEKPAR